MKTDMLQNIISCDVSGEYEWEQNLEIHVVNKVLILSLQ